MNEGSVPTVPYNMTPCSILASTLLFIRQKGHPIRKNLCFKNLGDIVTMVNVSGRGTARTKTPVGTKGFGLSREDNNKWRLRSKGQPRICHNNNVQWAASETECDLAKINGLLVLQF